MKIIEKNGLKISSTCLNSLIMKQFQVLMLKSDEILE